MVLEARFKFKCWERCIHLPREHGSCFGSDTQGKWCAGSISASTHTHWFLLANHCCKEKYARAATEPLLCKETGFPYACSAATTSPLGCHQPHIPERQGNVGTGWEAPHLLTWPRKQKEGADREGRQDHQLKLLNFCFVFFFSFNKLNKKSKDYSLHNLTCL